MEAKGAGHSLCGTGRPSVGLYVRSLSRQIGCPCPSETRVLEGLEVLRHSDQEPCSTQELGRALTSVVLWVCCDQLAFGSHMPDAMIGRAFNVARSLAPAEKPGLGDSG